MNDLTLQRNTEQMTMSSKEIADLVDARHNDVIATIDRLFGKGLLRSSRKTHRIETGGRPLDVYRLIERDTHLVVAGYSDEHRAKVIDRWQELEQSGQPRLPQTMAEALRLAADQAERIEHQQKALEAAKPAVEFVGRYVAADSGSKGFRQVCKLLNAKGPEFRKFLQDQKIMYPLGREWTPYQQHIDAGRFVVKAGVAKNEHAFNSALFTAKGVNWVAGLWAAHVEKKAA